MGHFGPTTEVSRHFRPRSNVSRHFGPGTEVSGLFGPTFLGPKYLGSDVAWVEVSSYHVGKGFLL